MPSIAEESGRFFLPRAVRRASLAALATAVLTGAGCQRSLFQQNLPRNQFQVYEEMRGDFAPAQETDVFGRPQPALRARLVRSP